MTDAVRAEGPELQRLLSVLLDLELTIRHAHWNCYGAGFRDLHLHLGALAEVVGGKADAIAERALASGVSPDGRPATIVATSGLPSLPAGPMLVEVAIAGVAAAIGAAIDRCRHHRSSSSATNPVTDAVVVSILEVLEHHRWMLLAEFSAEPPATPPPDPD